jgi:hypothetical protein
MHAQVAPREELLAGTPHNEVLAEHPSGNRSTIFKVCDERYRMPIVYEDRVIDHRYLSSKGARCDDATPLASAGRAALTPPALIGELPAT